MDGLLGAYDLYRGTAQSIYACARTEASLVTINIVNRGKVDIRVSVGLTTTKHAFAADAEYIEYSALIRPNGVLERTSVFVPSGRYITCLSDSSNVSAQVWGLERGDPYPVVSTSINTGTAPTWTTSAIPTLYSGDTVAIPLTATDSPYPPTYAVTSGTLPTGLSLSQDGTISGRVDPGSYPGSAGTTTSVTVTATDGGLNLVPRTFSIVRKWRDGSSSAQAAATGDAIKAMTGTTTSGYYWLTLNNAPAQVYIDMTENNAWHLAMRCSSAGSANTFGWSSAYWTDQNGLNDTADPTTGVDIKNAALWNNFRVGLMRITASTLNTNLRDNQNVFGNFNNYTLNGIFTQGNNTWDGQINLGRSNWINWANSVVGTSTSFWDNQPNCNNDSINCYYTYHAARIGISFNNETDCLTNDSGIGFGQYRNGLTELSCGAIRWSPDTRYPANGWVWVR